MPYLPALAGDIGPETGAIRHDWGQTLSELCEDQYLRPLNAWARDARHEVPLADVWDSAGDAFQPAAGGSAGRRRHAVEAVFDDALGNVGQPSLRASRDLERDVDVAAFAGIPRHAARYEGGGRPALPAGRESAGGARLAVYSAFGAGEPGWRFYAAAVFNQHNPWWIVMPDITTYLQRVSWLLAAGKACHRRRGVPADARCVRGLHAGAGFGEPGDGRADRSGAGAGDSGRGLQLRFHRRWSDRGKGHHAPDV